MLTALRQLWSDDSGQDIAEYALLLTVILVLVIATVSLIGTRANAIFQTVADALQ